MLISIGVSIGLVLIMLAGLYFFWAPRPKAPVLPTTVSRHSLTVGDKNRDYIAVVPDALEAGAPLWIVLHGSSSSAEHMRFMTGYQFERIAAREGFVVVYADAYKQSWHDGRTATRYPARTEGIDDVRFLTELSAAMVAKYNLDPQRVFAFGYSNGGHMLYKVAATSPDSFAGIVVAAANLSEPDSSDLPPFPKPIPTMLVAGTKDPLNPYAGGKSGNRGNSLGQVKSALATAEFFARLNGVGGPASDANVNSVDGEPERSLVAGSEGRRKSVVLREYGAGSAFPVRLYSVNGGGHVVPATGYRAPRIMGRSPKNFDAPAAAWDFAQHAAPLSR
jgi:polyhydroxybutyrate depolymerase